jgi:hypothetical protein
VPVFRADNGNLLEKPYFPSILTAPAVNWSAAYHRVRDATQLVRIMKERAAMLLGIAVYPSSPHPSLSSPLLAHSTIYARKKGVFSFVLTAPAYVETASLAQGSLQSLFSPPFFIFLFFFLTSTKTP